MLRLQRTTAVLFVLLAVCGAPALAQQSSQTTVPARLSFVEGTASFWRPGAEDWVAARVNTPLAAGDALYSGDDSNIELQIGSRAFVRAGENTQLSLINQEPDYLQFKVPAGQVSFDLRSLPSGYTVEIDTPNAVFIIEHTGYYRVDVNGDTHFITRRAGRAAVTPAGSETRSISPSEEVVVRGRETSALETYVAPELDTWDRWNYARTDHQSEAVSTRYLPSGVYGADALDQYGNWRVVPEYGPVWVPERVPPGWAPYSTGSWIWDPYYGWTWIDDAPWGWAPSHYGRWVSIDGLWGWAPGPAIARPAYAPALVAFFGIGVGRHVSVGIGTGVGWVALGWGEPLVPWWGAPGFVGVPWWGGWGGPRVVNNVVIRKTTVVNVRNITYHNTKVPNSVVTVHAEHFGREHVHAMPVAAEQGHDLRPVHGALPVKPVPASLVAGAASGIRPPQALTERPVMATRPPRRSSLPWRTKTPTAGVEARPELRIVTPSRRAETALPRPAFGAQAGPERERPPLPPRFREMRQSAESAPPSGEIRERGVRGGGDSVPPRITAPELPMPSPRAPSVRETPPAAAPVVREMPAPREPRESRRGEAAPGGISPEAGLREHPQHEPRALPGDSANRMFPRQAHERRRFDDAPRAGAPAASQRPEQPRPERDRGRGGNPSGRNRAQ